MTKVGWCPGTGNVRHLAAVTAEDVRGVACPAGAAAIVAAVPRTFLVVPGPRCPECFVAQLDGWSMSTLGADAA